MRIGYFGGSFDPPHLGHLAVARAARRAFDLDRVLLAPTGRQPLKPDGPQASFSDRLRMVEILCANEPGLLASEIDAPRPDGNPNFTADTLCALQQDLPREARLFSIIGVDAFLGLPRWRSVDRLFELADWIVVSRPGFDARQIKDLFLTPVQRARTHLLEDVQDPTSATDVRARLRAGQPVEDLLPVGVSAYIDQHRLYRT